MAEILIKSGASTSVVNKVSCVSVISYCLTSSNLLLFGL